MGSILGVFIIQKSGFLEVVAKIQTATTEEVANLVMTNLSGIALYLGYAIFLMIIVFTGIILLLVKRKKFYVNHTAEELPKGQRFSSVFLNVGMLLFSIFWIIQIVVQLFQ